MRKFLKFVKQEQAQDGTQGGGQGGGQQQPAAPTGQPQQQPAAQQPTATQPQAQQPATPPAAVPTQIDYGRSASAQVDALVKDAGLDPTKVSQAIMANGGQMTVDIYQAIVAKHGEGVAGLMAGQFTQMHTAANAAQQERNKAIYDQCAEAFKGSMQEGVDTGETVWAEINEWAKENVPNDERKELNKMIGMGGMAAKMAVQELVNRVQGDAGYTQPAQLMDGDNLADTGVKAISKREYTQQLDKLLNEGHQYESPAVKALQRQRKAGMARGL